MKHLRRAWKRLVGLLAGSHRDAELASEIETHLLMQTEDIMTPNSGEPTRRAGAFSVELPPGTERFWQGSIRFRVFEIEQAANSR